MSDYGLVFDTLKDFESRLRSVVDRAWAEWMATPQRSQYRYLRTKSNIIFDIISRIALEEFGGAEGVSILSKNATFKLLFKNMVLVRFKKSNSKGIGSNIETQATLDFIDPHAVLPGLVPVIQHIEICYQVDDLGISLLDVSVVARNRNKRLWDYPLSSDLPKAELLFLPQAPEDTAPPVVTPKKQADEHAKKE